MFKNPVARIRVAGLRLEALEDRSTPAVVNLSTTAFSAVDRMFLTDASRFSLLEAQIGGLVSNLATTSQGQTFGQQLASTQNAGFIQELPLLVRSGLNFQLTPTDGLLLRDLPTFTGPSGLNQILVTSAVIQIQSISLFQAEATFGTNTTARAFAQSGVSILQGQLQTTLALLGQNGAATTFSMFNQIGQFGTTSVLGASGLVGSIGFNATLNSANGSIPFSTNLGTFGTTSAIGAATQFGGATTFSGGGTATPGVFGSTNSFAFVNFGGGTPGMFG